MNNQDQNLQNQVPAETLGQTTPDQDQADLPDLMIYNSRVLTRLMNNPARSGLSIEQINQALALLPAAIEARLKTISTKHLLETKVDNIVQLIEFCARIDSAITACQPKSSVRIHLPSENPYTRIANHDEVLAEFLDRHGIVVENIQISNVTRSGPNCVQITISTKPETEPQSERKF